MIQWVILVLSLVTIAVGVYLSATQRDKKTQTNTPTPNNTKPINDITRGSAHKPQTRTESYSPLQIKTNGSVQPVQSPFLWQTETKSSSGASAAPDTVPNPLYVGGVNNWGSVIMDERTFWTTTISAASLFSYGKTTQNQFDAKSKVVVPTGIDEKFVNTGIESTRAFVISQDGLRAALGSESNSQAFGQRYGEFSIFERSSTDQPFKFKQVVRNPFGSQLPQFDRRNDPYVPSSEVSSVVDSDGFGEVINIAVNNRSENYLYVTSGNFTADRSTGRFVSVFKEDKDGTVSLDYVLNPPENVLTTSEARDEFAWTHDIYDKWLFASSPRTSSVLVFERQADDSWVYKSKVDGEGYFGREIRVDPVLGSYVLISNPAISTSKSVGKGGSLTSYKFDNGTLTQVDQISAVAGSSDNGSFAEFVHVDSTFRVVAVSVNTNTSPVLNLTTRVSNGSATLPSVYFYSINPTNGKFGGHIATFVQPANVPVFADPSYGRNMSLSIDGEKLTAVIPSIANNETDVVQVELEKI